MIVSCLDTRDIKVQILALHGSKWIMELMYMLLLMARYYGYLMVNMIDVQIIDNPIAIIPMYVLNQGHTVILGIVVVFGVLLEGM